MGMAPRFAGRIGLTVLAAVLAGGVPVLALGVGDATWTPARSETTVEPSRFLVPGDAFTFRTEATWDPEEAEALAGYLATDVRYTHEVNDRSGRLSATGYWATNHPDPAFDRDDDDGDGRWEEAEMIAGSRVPEAGRAYTAAVQLSRWHAKRAAGECRWVWDRRQGDAEILSQLSRGLFGEWQAERYTLSYGSNDYPRVEARRPGDRRRARGPMPRGGARRGTERRHGDVQPADCVEGAPGAAGRGLGSMDRLRGHRRQR